MDNNHLDAQLKHERLKKMIMSALQDGKYKPGDKLPSQNEMAESFGISPGTVREAIASLVHNGLLYRVQGKGTFVSDIRKKPVTIALITPHFQTGNEIKNVFGYNTVAPLVMNLQDEAFKNNIDLLLYLNDDSIEYEKKNIIRAIEANVDGIIIYYTGECENDEYIQSIQNRGIPLVMIDKYIKGFENHYVGSDNFNSSKRAVKCMIKNGYKDIICIANSSSCSSMEERVEGYASAMDEFGLEKKILPRWNPTPTNKGEEDEAYKHVTEFLRNYTINNLTGFFNANGLFAAGTVRALTERLIDPKKLAISFFDEQYFYIDERILTIKIIQSFESISRKAIDVMIKKLNNLETSKTIIEPIVKITHGSEISLNTENANIKSDNIAYIQTE